MQFCYTLIWKMNGSMLCQSKMAYNHLNGAVRIHNRDEGVDINVQGKKKPASTNKCLCYNLSKM